MQPPGESARGSKPSHSPGGEFVRRNERSRSRESQSHGRAREGRNPLASSAASSWEEIKEVRSRES